MEQQHLYLQLAHGSDTKEITRFDSLADLLEQAARLFDLKPEEALFLTRNTHQVAAESVLGGELYSGDMLFAHVKGEDKFVSLRKSRDFIGITISDTGTGYTLVKVVHPRTDAFYAGIRPGDVIVSLNCEPLRGRRHFEVAAQLRSLPHDTPVVLEIWRAQSNGFSYIAPRALARKQLRTEDLSRISGRSAIRFRASDGRAFLCDCERVASLKALKALNAVFDSYFGFHDDDLALAVWDLGAGAGRFEDFTGRLAASRDLAIFEFPAEVIIQLWKAVDEARR